MRYVIKPPGSPSALRENLSYGSQTDRFSKYGLWFSYAAFIAAYALFFFIWPAQSLPVDVFAANVFLVAVCCLPLALWKSRGGRNLPMFELICLAYGVNFGLVGQLLPNSIIILSQRINFDWDGLLKATVLSTLGVASLISGYELTRRNKLMRWVRLVISMDLPTDSRRINYYLAGAPLLSIVALFLQGSTANDGRFGALTQVIGGQLYLAIVLLSYRFYDVRQRTHFITCFFFLAVVMAVVLGLSTGFLEQAVAPIVLVAIVRWHASRKFPVALVTCLVAVLVLLNSVKASYRQSSWFGEQGDFGSRVALWLDLASENVGTIADGDGQTVDDATDVLWKRFDLLHKFVWVLKKTPTDIPYYGGATYSYLLYGWIPRLVWPDKPSASEGASYRTDVDYQFVTPDSVGKTNIGIGFLPESYANFGIWGTVFVMALQGACFALLDRLLNGPQSQGGRAIYLALMIFFLNGIGSSTVTLFGAVFQLVLANGIILRFFATSWRLKPR
ncbi:hypothetical protein IAD21_00398 [Abditibacteriota bacterium]|nr:hypothetical protein IAD21_00398 [Abditibacteriota bacterium]